MSKNIPALCLYLQQIIPTYRVTPESSENGVRLWMARCGTLGSQRKLCQKFKDGWSIL